MATKEGLLKLMDSSGEENRRKVKDALRVVYGTPVTNYRQEPQLKSPFFPNAAQKALPPQMFGEASAPRPASYRPQNTRPVSTGNPDRDRINQKLAALAANQESAPRTFADVKQAGDELDKTLDSLYRQRSAAMYQTGPGATQVVIDTSRRIEALETKRRALKAQAKTAEKAARDKVAALERQTTKAPLNLNNPAAALQTARQNENTELSAARADVKRLGRYNSAAKSAGAGFLDAVALGLMRDNPLTERDERKQTRELLSIGREEHPVASGVGSFAGNAVEYATLGKAAEGFVKGTKLGKALGTFGAELAAQQAADTIVWSPRIIAEGMEEGKGFWEIAGDLTVDQLQNLAGNLVMMGIDRVIAGKVAARKGLSDAEEAQVKQVVMDYKAANPYGGDYVTREVGPIATGGNSGTDALPDVRRQAEAVFQQARQVQPRFIQSIHQAVDGFGAQVIDPGAKNIDSLAAKASRKMAEGLNYSVSDAKDHVRSAVLVRDFSQVPQVIDALKKNFPGLTGEVHIDQPLNTSGYRGIHLSVAMGDGINGEIQISTPEAWKIKLETDAIYEQWRNVDFRTMSPQQAAQMNADYAKSAKLWRDYYEGITPEVRRMASDSVMGLASHNVPQIPSYGAQAPFLNSKASEMFPVGNANTLPPSVIENSNIQAPPPSVKPNIDSMSSITDGPGKINGGHGPRPLGADTASYIPRQKTSQVRSNTFERTPLFTKAERNATFSNSTDSLFKYDVVSEKQSLKEAAQRVAEDFEGELHSLPGKMIFDGTDTDTAMLILERLKKEAAQTGDYSETRRWAKMIQQRGTEGGQRIQAFAKYTRTAEGLAVQAERVFSNQWEKFAKQNPNLAKAMNDMAHQLQNISERYAGELPIDPNEAAKNMIDAVEELSRRNQNLTPDFIQEAVAQIQKNRMDYDAAFDLLKKAEGMPGLTDAEYGKMMDLMAQAENLPEGSMKRADLEAAACKVVADKLPASAWEKANQWRYLAMLFNPTTHIRNILGNTAFGRVVVRTKNAMAGALEEVIIGNGEGRTKAVINLLSPDDRALMRAAGEDYANIAAYAQGTARRNIASTIEEQRRIFKNGVIEGARVFNNRALEVEDSWGLKSAYQDSLARYLKANGMDASVLKSTDPNVMAMVDIGRAIAVDDAQKATFRDRSELASRITNIKNDHKAAEVIVGGTVPFTKTPINIVKRGIEYSPVSLLGAVADIIPNKGILKNAPVGGLYRGTVKKSEFIDKIASGLTGSTLAALGALAAWLGWVTGGASDNKREKAYAKGLGEQEYAINLPGGGRYTIDWLSPAALPFFVGVETYNGMKERGGDGYSLREFMDALTKLSDPVMEMTMLQGLNNAFANVAYGESSPVSEFLGGAMANYAGQYIPTAAKKLARVSDDTQRRYYSEKESNLPDFFQSMRYKVQSGIPDLVPGNDPLERFTSKGLQPRLDMWGNEVKNTGGNAAGRFLYNALSPGFYSQVSNTPVDGEVQRLYDQLDESAVLPAAPSKSFTVAGQKQYLSGEEYTQLAKDKGQDAFYVLRQVTSSPYFQGLSDADKAEVVNTIYTYADQKAKNSINSAYEISSKSKAIDRIRDAGYPIAEYWEHKEKADANGNGSISGEEAERYLREAQMELQAKALWYSVFADTKKNPFE